MSDLPYKLSEGVIATKNGLFIDNQREWLIDALGCAPTGFHRDGYTIIWPEIAPYLRYREGEPWCYSFYGNVICGKPGVPEATHILYRLHRLAAILCDSAEAFRILYEAIKEFGDE